MAVDYWHWWALGGLLAIVEVVAPGVMFLWLGIAAGLVGALLLVWPGLSLTVQLLLFAALSVVSVLVWRRYQRARPRPSDQPHLNRRGEQYVGQHARLVAPIANGHGRIKLGDGTWLAAGPELPAGQLVEVTGADGVVLQVRPLQAPGTAEAPSEATTAG